MPVGKGEISWAKLVCRDGGAGVGLTDGISDFSGIMGDLGDGFPDLCRGHSTGGFLGNGVGSPLVGALSYAAVVSREGAVGMDKALDVGLTAHGFSSGSGRGCRADKHLADCGVGRESDVETGRAFGSGLSHDGFGVSTTSDIDLGRPPVGKTSWTEVVTRTEHVIHSTDCGVGSVPTHRAT